MFYETARNRLPQSVSHHQSINAPSVMAPSEQQYPSLKKKITERFEVIVSAEQSLNQFNDHLVHTLKNVPTGSVSDPRQHRTLSSDSFVKFHGPGSCPITTLAPVSPNSLLARSLAAVIPSPLVRRSRRSSEILDTSGFIKNNVCSGRSPVPPIAENGTFHSRQDIPQTSRPNRRPRSNSPSVTPRSDCITSFSEISSKSEATAILSPISLKPEELTVIDLDGVGVSLSLPVTQTKFHEQNKKNSRFQRLISWRLLSTFGLSNPNAEIETKDILKDVSGTFLPGRLVALLGPSGSGKTTLLNILAGRISHTSGDLRFNDELVTSPKDIKNFSAYVQQLDMFLPNLTVEEHLESQMQLRLGLKKSQRRLLIDNVIMRFGLAKCRNTLIGTLNSGISGGERKRLSVASEILTNPHILLADEPTTGIDSSMAISVVTILRKLATSGRSVIASLHQPSSQLFATFDEIMLLAEGRVLYLGDRLGSIEWFRYLGFECPKLTNPADFLVKIVSSPEHPEDRIAKSLEIVRWAELWKHKGDDFLQAWTDRDRYRFFESSKTYAQQSIEIALSRTISPCHQTPNLPDSSYGTTQESNEVDGKLLHPSFQVNKDFKSYDKNQQAPFSSLQAAFASEQERCLHQRIKVGVRSPTQRTILQHRLTEAVLRSFNYSSPRVASREIPSVLQGMRTRGHTGKKKRNSRKGDTSPSQRIIDKHYHHRTFPQITTFKKVSKVESLPKSQPNSLILQSPMSPPTFGLGSRIRQGLKKTEENPEQEHEQSISFSEDASHKQFKEGSRHSSMNSAVISSNSTNENDSVSPSHRFKEGLLVAALVPRKGSSWFQFRILLKRAVTTNSRDHIIVHARFFQTVFIALTYGSIFFRLGSSMEDSKSKLSAIFFVLTNQGLVGACAVCSTFISEKVVIRREVEGGLFNITPYITAKIVADIPVQTFFPIVFNTICFWMMGLHYKWSIFALSTLVALMVCNAAISVGYLGSATASSVSARDLRHKGFIFQSDRALITAQLWCLPALLFGGYAVKLDDIHAWLSPIQYLSYFRYGYIAYSYLVFNGEQIDVHDPRGHLLSGGSFVKSYVGFDLTGMKDFWNQILWLGVMIVIFRIAIILLVVPASKRWRENR